ncbi:MAG: HutD family protein [Flavobacteriales bacterium]
MKWNITRKAELTTATWKGGTTTQLFIYPDGTEYQKFNFDFRMSYATVEIPESTFTFMPGVTRHLMILRGELEIDHTNQYKKHLKKFDLDVFNGEWPTTAKGLVMDFNLMVRNGTEGNVEACVLKRGDKKPILADSSYDYSGLFVLAGDLIIRTTEDSATLHQGDFILLEHSEPTAFSLHSLSGCEVIFAHVKKTVLS